MMYFVDWQVPCATTFAGKNIKKQMFADIFTRIAKNDEEAENYKFEQYWG